MLLYKSKTSLTHGTQPKLQTRIEIQDMTDCKLKINDCKNLVLRTAKTGQFEGKEFFGCKNYPHCSFIVPLYFDETTMNEDQKKLANAFELFVRSNAFICATYGVVYFNLRQAAFMDYLLRTDIVVSTEYYNNVEIGLTGAKIYNALFYHLFLIPTLEIKRYLIHNFPNTYSNFKTTDFRIGIHCDGIDYENHILDENVFRPYSNIETYNR